MFGSNQRLYNIQISLSLFIRDYILYRSLYRRLSENIYSTYLSIEVYQRFFTIQISLSRFIRDYILYTDIFIGVDPPRYNLYMKYDNIYQLFTIQGGCLEKTIRHAISLP